MTLYLAKRPDLVRFFTTRTHSRVEAEDIVQEMFLKISASDDVVVENAAAYLYRLGTNVMLDRARARRRSATRDDSYYQAYRTGLHGGGEAVDSPSPEQAEDARRRLQGLIKAIDALPPQCRKVFIMHKLEERSHAEVAEALGISRSAVEKHMIAALKRLTEFKS